MRKSKQPEERRQHDVEPGDEPVLETVVRSQARGLEPDPEPEQRAEDGAGREARPPEGEDRRRADAIPSTPVAIAYRIARNANSG